MSKLNLPEAFKKFYSLRIRIIFSFTLLSFISASTYGLLSSFIYEVVNDQLFNWYISETSQAIREDKSFPQKEKNRSFVLGNSQQLYQHLVENYQLSEPFDHQDFEKMEILDHKEPIDNDEIIYEMVVNGKKLHIISVPREQQRQFLIYDVTGFLEKQENSNNINDKHLLWLTLPLTLLVAIIGVLLGIILSKHVISPLSRLAENVHDIDPEGPIPEFTSKHHLDEVDTLAKTIQNLMIKINQFVEHERRFSREVSHELRTPVTSIGIALDLLNASELDAQQQKFVGRIERAKQDMAVLIQTFLMLGRNTIDQTAQTNINIKDCVDNIVDKNSYLFSNKPIEVIIDIPENEELLVNESLFTVILSNLIRNSFQYTHSGSVTISGNQQQIKISDTGLGIPEKVKELIGDPYSAFQNNGTGLGLSIVKRIIQKIDWSICIDSQENNGTTVTVTPST